MTALARTQPKTGADEIGKYRIISRIGRGGMAEVFLAVSQGPIGCSKLVVFKRLLQRYEDDEAVREMFRVLRVGGQVFAATPFMQHFHAYPNHFQNFTLIGHRRLFERAGFTIESAGVCVGPTYAAWGLVFRYV